MGELVFYAFILSIGFSADGAPSAETFLSNAAPGPRAALEESLLLQNQATEALHKNPPRTLKEFEILRDAYLETRATSFSSEVQWMSKNLKKIEGTLTTLLGRSKPDQDYFYIRNRIQSLNFRLNSATTATSMQEYLDLFADFTGITSHLNSAENYRSVSDFEIHKGIQSLQLGVGGRGIRFYKSFFPFLIVWPSSQPLKIQDLNVESLFAVGFLGMTMDKMYADGILRYGLSFARHDLQHTYSSKREIILIAQAYFAQLTRGYKTTAEASIAIKNVSAEIERTLVRNQNAFLKVESLKNSHTFKANQLLDVLWFDTFHEGYLARNRGRGPFSSLVELDPRQQREMATALVRRLNKVGDLKGAVRGNVTAENILGAVQKISQAFPAKSCSLLVGK